MAAKKMGRPTDNPKPYRVSARVDAEALEILDAYTKQEKITVMEALRRAIKKLKDDLKQ
ncbi:MAG: ribbon-helix-helix protein, CopG family [Clostridia bacterium]|nr:ribbon-helix-helix protein, CopG family [Clostridia bacterium]